MGFDQDDFDYLILDSTTNKVYISHDVTFDESIFPYLKPSLTKDLKEAPQVRVDFEDNEEEEAENPDGVTTRLDSATEGTHDPPSCKDFQEEAPLPDDHQSGSDLPVLPPRVSVRNQNKKTSYKGMCKNSEYFTAHTFYDLLPSSFSADSLPAGELPPKSLKSALNMYDREDWLKACRREIKSLSDKKVLSLVDRPRDKKVI